MASHDLFDNLCLLCLWLEFLMIPGAELTVNRVLAAPRREHTELTVNRVLNRVGY